MPFGQKININKFIGSYTTSEDFSYREDVKITLPSVCEWKKILVCFYYFHKLDNSSIFLI